MPSKITKRLSGIPLILGGLFLLVNSVELGILKCHRLESMQVACQLTSSDLFGEHITLIATGQLKGAEVQTKKRNHRVVILTQNDNIPLINSYIMGKKGKVKKASQINTFLSASKPISLTIRQDNRWLGYLFGLIFIFSGICPIFLPDIAGKN